ncbi:MAG: hypothetical protein KGL91_01830 [Xanthomonadaceae bacterium]|nr:hypothetical protein [Xanthomonadaceae bacterium]
MPTTAIPNLQPQLPLNHRSIYAAQRHISTQNDTATFHHSHPSCTKNGMECTENHPDGRVGTQPACYFPHVPIVRLPKDWTSGHRGT